MIIILILGNSGKLPVIRCYDFSVCLRTGSNLEDINRFQSHTGKVRVTRTAFHPMLTPLGAKG